MPLGVGRGQNVGLLDFYHINFVAAGGIRVSQTHPLENSYYVVHES